MIEVALEDLKLFKNLVEIEKDDVYIDLHNDYECSKFYVDRERQVVTMSFESITHQSKQVKLVFSDAEIVEMSLTLQHGLERPITADNIYRGRFEKNGSLHEYSNDGKGYYYVEFDEGYRAELFANGINLTCSP